MLYPVDLVLCFPEGAVLREAVFKVATNCTSLESPELEDEACITSNVVRIAMGTRFV
jgi:hypothetical protein